VIDAGGVRRQLKAGQSDLIAPEPDAGVSDAAER